MIEQALALHRAGQLAQAQALCDQLVRANPRHADALHLSGVIALQTRQPARAAELIGKAVGIDAKVAVFHLHLGMAFDALGDWQEAAASFSRTVALEPSHGEAWVRRGNALRQLGQWDDALASFDQALALDPGNAFITYNRGNVLRDMGRLDEALASYDRTTALQPNFVAAHANHGTALHALGRSAEAVASLDQAIALEPRIPALHINRGHALHDLRQADAALASFEQALRLEPQNVAAQTGRARALWSSGRLEEAATAYRKAIALQPGDAATHSNLGMIASEQQQWDTAVDHFRQALALQAQLFEAWFNLGIALTTLRRLPEALDSYDHAIAVRPQDAASHANRAVVLEQLGRIDDAIAGHSQSLAIAPHQAQVLANRGHAHFLRKQLPHAARDLEQALALDPGHNFVAGTLLHTYMQMCRWDDLEAQQAALENAIASGQQASPPFAVLAWSASSALARQAARTWMQALHPANDALGPIAKRARPKRLRIGYYSADFHQHATAYLTAELFELHDRSQFELVGFSFGPSSTGAMRSRIEQAFDRFIDVSGMTDRAVAALSRQLEIDIAVDLKGITQDSRPGIFAHRAAPVQANYLGYPGTMGAPYIDYVIADALVITPEDRQHYDEKVVTLPHCYQVNDRQRQIAEGKFTRDEMGLPTAGFVFCCFNNNYKITPATFAAWMHILSAVEGSVLWLLEDHPVAATKLRLQAAKYGVDGRRLVFAKRLPLDEHLARHALADLFLDTLPYNAHTTASDALWCGLPLLTCIGNSFAGRVAASLLQAIGMPELVTESMTDYEARAVELAADPAALAALKEKLQRNRLATPLFDTEGFARHIESAYTAMAERHHAGMTPAHLTIDG